MFAKSVVQACRLIRIAAVFALAATILIGHVRATLVDDAARGNASMYLRLLQRIRLDEPTLPPFAHTRFCLEYPKDCRKAPIMFRSGRIKLTPQRIVELIAINARVNSEIRPDPNPVPVVDERWRLAPTSGSCHDYAVTKRHDLIARGWPAQSLLLAEVITDWGKHHLVLVVRTSTIDLVTDNLAVQIKPWTETSYKWVRIQSPQNPMFWAKVGVSSIASGGSGTRTARR